MLDEIVDRHAGKHVGLSVGVVHGDTSRTLNRGVVDRSSRQPVAADTIFEIGSVTKVFVATLLAVLAEEGVVSVDDSVNSHLPADAQLPLRGRPITLRDLATHTSGLPRLPPGLLRLSFPRHRKDPYAPFTREHFDRAIRQVRLRREPARRWRYSNFGAALLGHALELRTGVSFEQLVRDRICDPLGLVDTSVDVPSNRLGRFATGHGRRGRPVPHWQLPTLAGAGALRSTSADLLRFLRAQLEPGDDALGRAIAATHVPHARRHAIEQCLGWVMFSRRRSGAVYCHDGGTGGFRSFAGFTRAGTAVVVLANDTRSVGAVGMRILRDLDQV